jgi:hypothetical protein
MGLTLVFEGCSSLEGKRGESPPLVLAGRPTPEESTLQASGFFPQAAAHLRPFPLHTTSSAQNFILTQTLVTPPSPSYERSPRTVAFHSTLSSRPLPTAAAPGLRPFPSLSQRSYRTALAASSRVERHLRLVRFGGQDQSILALNQGPNPGRSASHAIKAPSNPLPAVNRHTAT